MNRRTSKLLGYVTRVLSQAEKPAIPKGNPRQLFNPAANLKRKLKAEWNRKPHTVRHDQRMGLVRTLIAVEEARG